MKYECTCKLLFQGTWESEVFWMACGTRQWRNTKFRRLVKKVSYVRIFTPALAERECGGGGGGGVTFDEWNVFSWCVPWRRVAWAHDVTSHNTPSWEPQIFRIYVLWNLSPKSSWHLWMKELRSFETSETTNPATYSYILAEQNLLQHLSENLRPQRHVFF